MMNNMPIQPTMKFARAVLPLPRPASHQDPAGDMVAIDRLGSSYAISTPSSRHSLLGDDQRREHEFLPSRLVYVSLAACGGLAGAVGASALSIHTTSDRPWLFLVAGIVCGGLAGNDLYSSRDWAGFGKYTRPVRWTLACSGAASLTAMGGVLLGVMPSAGLWMYGVAGALIGFGLWWRLNHHKVL